MEKEKQFTVAENLIVMVEPNKEHEFLMTTAEVAKGFGINTATLRGHKHEHRDELTEGKHFITSVGKQTHLGINQLRHIGPSAASSASVSSSSRNVRSCSATGRRTW